MYRNSVTLRIPLRIPFFFAVRILLKNNLLNFAFHRCLHGDNLVQHRSVAVQERRVRYVAMTYDPAEIGCREPRLVNRDRGRISIYPHSRKVRRVRKVRYTYPYMDT